MIPETPQPHPDNIGVGGVTCRCGGVSIPTLEASGCTGSWSIRCPSCGEWCEALAVHNNR